MVFAAIGIPLTVIMLAAIGDRLKHLIRSLIITFERRILKRKQTSNIKKKTLLAVFVTTVVAHVAFSAAAPMHDDWDFTIALYVWFVTMTTIGFGDFVPHQTFQTARVDSVFVTIYLMMVFFTCLALVATVLQASSDWADSKKPPTKDEIKLSLKRMASSVSKKKKKPSTSTSTSTPEELSRPYLVYSNYRNTDY